MLILQVHVIYSSLKKEVYNPQAVIPHARLLRQAFAHCGKFPTAASRRSLDRVSVPVCLIVLSNQILIVALVSSYLTNKLISRELLFRQNRPNNADSRVEIVSIVVHLFQSIIHHLLYLFSFTSFRSNMGFQHSFPIVIPLLKVNSHVLLTRPPLNLNLKISYDLHVLGIPLAFILSQDQTLLKYPQFDFYLNDK